MTPQLGKTPVVGLRTRRAAQPDGPGVRMVDVPHDAGERGRLAGPPIGPARGLLLGLAVGLVLWVGIIAIGWRLLRG